MFNGGGSAATLPDRVADSSPSLLGMGGGSRGFDGDLGADRVLGDPDNDSDTGDAIDVTNMSLSECPRDLFCVLRSRSRLRPLAVTCRGRALPQRRRLLEVEGLGSAELQGLPMHSAKVTDARGKRSGDFNTQYSKCGFLQLVTPEDLYTRTD